RAQSWGGQIPGPVWMRTAAGGFVLGLLALNFPQVLGLGESTIDAALHGDIALELLVALAIVKVLATSLSIGAGFSGGILGPALFVGAMLGAALGVALPELVPLDLSDISVYALAGMGAVISRVIGGPITTILIVFELTHSYSLTTAVMVAVVVASVIPSRRFSGSFFEHQLSAQGIDLSVGSEIMRLRTRTLESVLDPIFLSVDPHCSVDDARTIMANCPHDADLFLLDDAGRLLGSLRAAQLLDLAADTPVSTVASTTNLTLYRDTTIDEAMLSLADFVGVSVAVVDDPNSQKMLGIIHENALFTAYRDAIEDTRSSTK
nr:chloride channel protein [Gammaproteobacteria bacterium]